MPPSSRIPPLLEPYIRLSDKPSFILLTEILGATANWLVIRFLCDALSEQTPRRTGHGYGEGIEGQQNEGNKEGDHVRVILVSWLRNWEFWRGEARKATGLDLARLSHDRRFVFIDGLSKLYLPDSPQSTQPTQTPLPTAAPSISSRILGQTISPLPARGPRPINPRGTPPNGSPAAMRISAPSLVSSTSTSAPPSSQPTLPEFNLTSPTLANLKQTIESAITHLTSSSSTSSTPPKILLILDSPDLLLATASTTSSPMPTSTPGSNQPLTPSTLSHTLLNFSLNPAIHTLLTTLQADHPLISPSTAHPDTPATPLETEGAAFLTRIAHMSDRVISCRLLDTGVARDVSGVVRITGRERWEDDEDEREQGEGKEGKQGGNAEFLYFVGADGGVRVFERGGGGGE